jgi:hypothetical protein
MANGNFFKISFKLSLLVVCLAVVSCSKKSNSSKKSAATTTTTVTPTETREIDSGVAGDTVQRYCTSDLIISSSTATTEARLSEFFQQPVSDLQNYASICFKVWGTGTYQAGDATSNVKAAIRVEYEDHYGVSALEFASQQNIFYINATNNSVEVIFMDGVGFLQIKGSGTGAVTLSVKYHMFPSFEDQMNEQLLEIQTKCKNGTYTVAQCLGYNWPSTYWWNETTYTSDRQKQLDLAKQILNNTSKTKSLGTSVINRTDYMDLQQNAPY